MATWLFCWLAQITRPGEIGHYEPVKYVRIFADKQGLSHFEDVELHFERRHVADGVAHLRTSGRIERVVSDGERRRLTPGDVVLREDTTGEGSLTTPRGEGVVTVSDPPRSRRGTETNERAAVNRQEMLAEFQRHRDAEISRDLDAVIDTFVDDCYLETVALGTRSEGRKATRVAYESYFTAFSDIDSDYQGFAAGDDVLVGWGVLSGTSGGEWLGLAPTGGRFAIRFTNVATFRDGRMAGESLYFDLATLCEQAGFSVDAVRAAAKARAAPTP